MRRRKFITLLGGAAAWPLTARAQQTDNVRRIGVLMGWEEDDPDAKVWLSGFVQGLAELGWTDGRNARIDVRWASDNAARMRIFAKELVDLKPDVILSTNTPETAVFQRETRTIPIVFVIVGDPVGSGCVSGLARPDGNITGFGIQEPSMAGKWLEVLTEIAPGLKRAAFMFNPDTAPFIGYLPVFEAAARSLKVAPIAAPVHNDAEIETVIGSLGGEPGGGFVGAPDSFMVVHRALITSLAARSNVPAIYPYKFFPKDGGLASYGADFFDEFRRSASYVDRILRGAKVSELPVQYPTKLDLVVNLRAAKAIGLTIPESFLARADQVIE